MRIIPLAATAAVVLLSGCASRGPAVSETPPVAVGKDNRFVMTQNGRRMSADDFDRWMRARGIRIAKGAPKPAPKARTPSRTTSRTQVQASAAPVVAPRPKPKRR